MSGLYDRLAELPLRVESYALERLERDVSSDFTRVSTLIRIDGAGHSGLGEEVTYEVEDQEVLQRAGAVLPLAGDWTFGTFCEHLATLELWPSPPQREPSRNYRRWAYESAALDLALRQAGRALHEVLEREPRPVRFVVSLRLGDPPSMAALRSRLDAYPALQFKLDPTNDWTPELVAEIAATGAVESLDLKGQYHGSIVDVAPDPDLYRLLLDAFPDAWLEDPHTELLDAVPHERVTWDAIIHSVADITGLPFTPPMVNVKPSRLGPVREVLAAYEHCEAHGIGMYGGGQFELGAGRGQIQLLASLFHADGPNDVAPGGYNDTEPGPGLPDSPLAAQPDTVGFRWKTT